MLRNVATYAAFIAGAFVSLLIAESASGQASRVLIPISAGKRGCRFEVGAKKVDVFYERVIVIAKRETPPDMPDELWVLLPDRLEQKRDANGHLLTDNIPAAEVLFLNPKDGPVAVHHQSRLCHCPDVLWSHVADISAER